MRALAVLLFLVTGLLPTPAVANSSKPPNILIVMADDLADWHLGCYGNKVVKTPNIDRLAVTGVRMANSFVCTPICSPSRATFFSGLVPRQHGIHDFLTPRPAQNPEQGWNRTPESWYAQPHISDYLSRSGYECGYVGKWHMEREQSPQHSYSYWRAWTGSRRGAFNDPNFSADGKPLEETGYSTEVFTRLGTDFVQKKRDKPFFLVVSYQNPHVPYDGHPQRYYDMYREADFSSFGIEPAAPNALREGNYLSDPVSALRKAAAATTALDDQIPVLLKALSDSGQRENTLVVFTGDNGFLYGRHGGWSKGWAKDPIVMYEEVIRVPMIFNWPGKLAARKVRRESVSFYDMLPTLLDVAGVEEKLDADRYCGESYWNLVQGKRQRWDNVRFFNFRYADAVSDGRYKLILRKGQGPDELFDLEQKPREKTNRIDDPTLAGIRDRLHTRLLSWRAKFRDPGADLAFPLNSAAH